MRVEDVAARFPKVGNLTAADFDEATLGAVMRAMIDGELEVRRTQWPVGSGWDHQVTDMMMLAAYDRLKDDMLTGAQRLRVR